MKKKPEANVDQNFIDMLTPVQTFEIMGTEIKAHPLTIADFGELKVIFKDWQSFEVADLYNTDPFEALSTIVWIGTRDNTPAMKSKAVVDKVINLQTLNKWVPVFSYISGVRSKRLTPMTHPPPKPRQRRQHQKTPEKLGLSLCDDGSVLQHGCRSRRAFDV